MGDEMKQHYLSLIDSARQLIATLEAVGCSGFNYQRAGIIPDQASFAIAEGMDTAIMLLRDTISACIHAVDLIERKPYCRPLSDTERKLIKITSGLLSSANCSTLQNAAESTFRNW